MAQEVPSSQKEEEEQNAINKAGGEGDLNVCILDTYTFNRRFSEEWQLLKKKHFHEK